MPRSTASAAKLRKRELPPSLAWNSNPALGFFAALLAGLPFVAYYNYDHPWILMVLAFFYIVLAILLQSRLIVGTLTGIGLSLLFDSGSRTRDLETQLYFLIAQFATGAVIGITIGVLWDRADFGLPSQRDRRR